MDQNTDLTKLNMDQLKTQLRARKLKVGGNKAELIARLRAALTGVPVASPAAAMPVPPAGYAPAMVPGAAAVAPLP